MTSVSDLSGGSPLVRISAGNQMNDDSDQDPLYHYNVIQMLSAEDGSIIMRVWPRVWSERYAVFHSDINILSSEKTYIDMPLRLRLPASHGADVNS